MTGAVKVLKMPPVLNPLDKEPAAPPTGEGQNASKEQLNKKDSRLDQFSAHSLPSSADPEGTPMLKNDIERYQTEDLALDTVLISTIPARKRTKFVDPFPYDPTAENNPDEAGNASLPPNNLPASTEQTIEEDAGPKYNYLLGETQFKDSNGGDAGCMYKKPEIMPQIFFIRASYVNKVSCQMPHPEVQYLGKGLKQFMITTGIGIAYMNDFVVSIHNI